jgi:hypothetical protein
MASVSWRRTVLNLVQKIVALTHISQSPAPLAAFWSTKLQLLTESGYGIVASHVDIKSAGCQRLLYQR